jgi:hypothetical protein
MNPDPPATTIRITGPGPARIACFLRERSFLDSSSLMDQDWDLCDLGCCVSSRSAITLARFEEPLKLKRKLAELLIVLLRQRAVHVLSHFDFLHALRS